MGNVTRRNPARSAAWLVCLAIGVTFVATPAAGAVRAGGHLVEPAAQSTVEPTFQISGDVYDREAACCSTASQVDVAHFWALPIDGSPGVFLNAIACDPAAACRFSFTASGLTRGVTYALVAYAHLVATDTFETAASAVITIAPHPPSEITSLGTIVSGPADTRAADSAPGVSASSVAYDDKHDVFLHVWQHADEVLGRFIGFDGAVKGDAFTIATEGTFNPMKPMVAYTRGAIDDTFFVFHASDAAGANARNVFVQRVRYTGAGVTGGALVGGIIDASNFSRDPAHVQAPGGIAFNPMARQFLLSWTDNWDIYVRTFTADGVATGDQRTFTDPTRNGCGIRAVYSDGRAAYDWHTNRYLLLVVSDLRLGPRCPSHSSTTGVMLDATTLGVVASRLFCSAGFFPCDGGSATPMLDGDGFVATFDLCCLFPGAFPSGDDVRAVRVTASGETTLGAPIGTRANDTGGRVQSDPDISRMLVVALAAPSSWSTTSTSPTYGLRVAALDRTGVPLTAAVNLTTTPALSSPDLVVARDGTFAASYTTADGAILHRISVASDGPVKFPFSNVVSNLDGPTGRLRPGTPFDVLGWAIDFGASTGIGIDAVHAWAYPAGGGASPIFLGATQTFVYRDDLAAAFAPRFGPSGFQIAASGLPAGTYTIVAYPHSALTGTFSQTPASRITVAEPVSQPVMSLDIPLANSTVGQVFDVGGWAIDRGATSGGGVDVVHIYAFPSQPGGPEVIFLGVAPVNRPRPDVASLYGAQFGNAGFRFTTPPLEPARGPYRIVAFAHSTVTNTFNNAAFADGVIVQASDQRPLIGPADIQCEDR